MTVLAHVGGVPLEELVPALAAGTGTGLLLVRARLAQLLRRHGPG